MEKAENCRLQSRLPKWSCFEITFATAHNVPLAFITPVDKTSDYREGLLLELICFTDHLIPEIILLVQILYQSGSKNLCLR